MNQPPWERTPPNFTEIEEAAGRIAAACVVTPLLESSLLNARLGGRILVKAEGLQRTGSFKMRGAFNRMSQLTDEERRRGVVAYSSGNHAQAVAAAARALGTTAVIVMPADAPHGKIEKTKAYGGEVVLYDRYREDRAAIGEKLARERGLMLVPPYEDRRILAGAGTLGREVAAQSKAMGASLDTLLVGCSGGGLIAGCALAMEVMSPGTAVMAVEPAGFDDTGRSLASGTRVANDPEARSICDSLLAPTPGELTFTVNQRLLKGALAVTDAEALEGLKVAFRDFGLVAEPGGVLPLAAVVTGRYDACGKTVAVVLSGSNVDLDAFAEWITATR